MSRYCLFLAFLFGCSGSNGLPVGSACVADAPNSSACGDLASGYFCDSDHPNGYCKRSCHGDVDCPSGSVCAGAGMVAPGECHASCTQATKSVDCRLNEGYECKDHPDDASHDYCDAAEG